MNLFMFSKKCLDYRVKNTKRKITPEVAYEVQARDWYCIICEYWTISEIHHVFYWNEANYSDSRNDPDQLVWLCNKCHYILHSSGGNEYRELTKKYLKSFYGNNT